MLGDVAEQIELLIKKEARRQVSEREKEIKEHTREQKDIFKDKLSHAIHEHKDQQIKATREIVERYRDQIHCLKRDHKSIVSKLQRDNHDYICEVVEKVSSLYSIPIKNVRRDLAPVDDIHCLGVRKNGKLCTNRAIREGYCCIHVTDPRPGMPIIMPSGPVRHNHPFPSGIVSGCPACEREKIEKEEVRELNSIM
jgi:hypothetical protein